MLTQHRLTLARTRPSGGRIRRSNSEPLPGALATVGWVAEALVNRTTGHIVGGHLRIQITLEREILLQALIATRLQVLSLEASHPSPPPRAEGRAGYRGWLELCAVRLARLEASEAARRSVERDYLAGHGALFPVTAEAWSTQVEAAKHLTAVGAALIEHDAPGLVAEMPTAPAEATAPESAVVAALAASLVSVARVSALKVLGEDDAAQRAVQRWLGVEPNAQSD